MNPFFLGDEGGVPHRGRRGSSVSFKVFIGEGKMPAF
jgi:hypothetical protein